MSLIGSQTNKELRVGQSGLDFDAANFFRFMLRQLKQ